MKKFFLVLFGSFFLCVFLLFVFTLRFGERWKIIPGLYSYPPCNTGSTSSLFFETPEDYVAWIENPDLGIDLTSKNPCNGDWHKHASGTIYPDDYRYSIRSDLQRMFVVDRMYPLVHLQNNAFSDGNPRKYGYLSDGSMVWTYRDENENKYSLSIRTDEKRPYFTKDTSTSPSTWEREMSREGDPYSIAPDPENYTVQELGNETYYISEPWPNNPNRFTIRWFEGNYVASLIVTPKQPFVYDADTMDIGHYLSYFEMEFVDLPPLQEKTFPFLWVGITGGICLAAGISLFFVVRKHRNRKKPS